VIRCGIIHERMVDFGRGSGKDGGNMRAVSCCRLLCILISIVAWRSPAEPAGGEQPVQIISPTNGAVLDSFLAVDLRWQYPQRPQSVSPFPFLNMTLQVADNPDFRNPIVDMNVDDHQNDYAIALAPDKKYYWRLTPVEIGGPVKKYFTALRAEASFVMGKPQNHFKADDAERYKNPRVGAHWQYMTPIVPQAFEPLSPWFDAKAFKDAPPPTFAEIKDRFPVPVWDGHPEALAAWNYCWQTLLRVWIFAPHAPDHEAVANLLGYPAWGPWGSTMVFDSCFILHFSRYGAQAYPFITCLDNCYARQHENGFICRESDRENREAYTTFPVNPPLFAWAEWEWYRITGDKERLRGVFTPIVKHYEWWMKYQRRENGLYWIQGLNEADDSPRNSLMYYAVSATSYQALAALELSKMAAELDRPDLKAFFDAQHREIGDLVNSNFWDGAHGVYNDLTKDGRFITELQPGVLCKHAHMFWPLLAEIGGPKQWAGLLAELKNPASFNRSSGFPSLSADSQGYNKDNGQYWRGAVWPSAQAMIQEGLKTMDNGGLLQEAAEKYYHACLTAFQNQKTIQENLSPDKAVGYGAPDFVGWGGIGPVANLIEYMLGFNIDAPARTIAWNVRRTERHGLQNLEFNGFKVDMICEGRAAASDPCKITVQSGGSFVLKVSNGEKAVEKQIGPGAQTFQF